MYVLADLEWIEDKSKKISFTQIAMVRVDEKWNATDSIFSRIRPINPSVCQWKHMAFTGGTPADFLNAPDSNSVFHNIADWLQPEDVICWWHGEAKNWLQKLIHHISNKQIVLAKLVAEYMGEKGVSNPYRTGKQIYLDTPKAKHDSRNDVEMMRRLLEHIRFPQPIPKHFTAENRNHMIGAKGMAYHAHVDTNIIHKKGCPQIPTNGQVKGYNELTKPVGKGYIPCECVSAEFRAARKQRNKNIISRTEYNFLYTPDSPVFHRRDCKIMLRAKEVRGTVLYTNCLATGRQPCKVCNPTAEDESYAHVYSSKENLAKHNNPIKLSAGEQRAINRHRQAQEQRVAIERNTALTQEKRDDLYTLSRTSYAFFAAKGYTNFHLRNCKKLSGLSNVEGFAWYRDATRAGYCPCKYCKPTPKHDAVVSLPIYSTKRSGESAGMLKGLCSRYRYVYWEEAGISYIETEVGIWRINASISPYRLEHINRVKSPDNRTDFHRQPRLFLSMHDAFYYIKKHDEGLLLGVHSG